jgi:hypothetical protein
MILMSVRQPMVIVARFVRMYQGPTRAVVMQDMLQMLMDTIVMILMSVGLPMVVVTIIVPMKLDLTNAAVNRDSFLMGMHIAVMMRMSVLWITAGVSRCASTPPAPSTANASLDMKVKMQMEQTVLILMNARWPMVVVSRFVSMYQEHMDATVNWDTSLFRMGSLVLISMNAYVKRITAIKAALPMKTPGFSTVAVSRDTS